MTNDDKEALYWRIDGDDEMSDKEKRDAYFSTISEEEDRERWESEQSFW